MSPLRDSSLQPPCDPQPDGVGLKRCRPLGLVFRPTEQHSARKSHAELWEVESSQARTMSRLNVQQTRRKIVEVNVRSGEPRDVDAVLSSMRELAEHEGHSQYFELTSEALHQACFAEPRRIELIVAEADRAVVGYATCMLQFSPWMGRDYLFLDDLYVRDEVRGLGIGSRLLRQVGALALERGVDVRWHVEIENRSAQKLYRALGAELREKLIAYWSGEAIRGQVNGADSQTID